MKKAASITKWNRPKIFGIDTPTPPPRTFVFERVEVILRRDEVVVPTEDIVYGLVARQIAAAARAADRAMDALEAGGDPK